MIAFRAVARLLCAAALLYFYFAAKAGRLKVGNIKFYCERNVNLY